MTIQYMLKCRVKLLFAGAIIILLIIKFYTQVCSREYDDLLCSASDFAMLYMQL